MKHDKKSEQIGHDAIGNEVHIFDDSIGKTFIKKISMASWLPTGAQYCPECHILMIHKDDYWECDDCGHTITDEEADNGEGYPTIDATYDADYDIYYGENND